MFLSPFRMISRVGTLLLVGYIGWQGWVNLGPGQNPRQSLANRAVPQIVDDLRDHRDDMREAALLPFTGDSSGYFSDTLRKTIVERGTFELAEPGVIDRLKEQLGISSDAVELPEEAIAAAGDMDVDCVIFGRVDRFESFNEGAQIDVTYNIADLRSGETIYTARYFEDTSQPELPAGIVGPDENVTASNTTASPTNSPTISEYRTPKNLTWWIRRSLSWGVVVLLLPVFTIGFIKTMVAKRSNKVNAFVLAIYTIADAFLAYILVGPAIGSLWPLVGFSVAVIVAFIYNVQIMTFAVKLSEE